MKSKRKGGQPERGSIQRKEATFQEVFLSPKFCVKKGRRGKVHQEWEYRDIAWDGWVWHALHFPCPLCTPTYSSWQNLLHGGMEIITSSWHWICSIHWASTKNNHTGRAFKWVAQDLWTLLDKFLCHLGSYVPYKIWPHYWTKCKCSSSNGLTLIIFLYFVSLALLGTACKFLKCYASALTVLWTHK